MTSDSPIADHCCPGKGKGYKRVVPSPTFSLNGDVLLELAVEGTGEASLLSSMKGTNSPIFFIATGAWMRGVEDFETGEGKQTLEMIVNVWGTDAPTNSERRARAMGTTTLVYMTLKGIYKHAALNCFNLKKLGDPDHELGNFQHRSVQNVLTFQTHEGANSTSRRPFWSNYHVHRAVKVDIYDDATAGRYEFQVQTSVSHIRLQRIPRLSNQHNALQTAPTL
ncbi:hypothetical protein DL96DRAFT_1765728 [Flagelloscypha sp. PMI_526]|nr:hypothetical protein DL96DRAFT_1765728 [Flagelloscypha sp. PMI_526]